MKIGVSSPYFSTMSGGERYMLTIAEYLSREHRVDIFWDDPKIKDSARDKLSIDLTRTNIVPNVFAPRVNVLQRIKVTRSYDVVIVLSDGSIPVSAAKKNILHFQRPFPAVNGKKLATQLKLKRFQSVVVNSKFTKKWIDRTYGVSSTVLYPPVAIDEFSPAKKERIILTVGRFHPFKKQDALISVFTALHEVLPKWKLVLIGGLLDQDKTYLEHLQHISKNVPVALLPNASFETLQKYYGKARVYWHAAGYGESESTYPEAMEHFGITTVEAMASGCVPIVYSGGGQREIVVNNKNGLLWETDEELLKKTIQIVKNPSEAQALRKQTIKKSDEYSRSAFCEKLETIVKRINENK